MQLLLKDIIILHFFGGVKLFSYLLLKALQRICCFKTFLIFWTFSITYLEGCKNNKKHSNKGAHSLGSVSFKKKICIIFCMYSFFFLRSCDKVPTHIAL